MTTLLLVGTLMAQTAAPEAPRIRSQTMTVADVGAVTYGVAAPAGDAAARPRPLVLALHPGGERMHGYGSRFMQQIVLPALGDLDAVVVAPDCPAAAKSWADPAADRAVLAILEKVRGEYKTDSRRVLVVGFSMGGRGAWFMSSQHPDLFTGAIVMAGSTRELQPDSLGKVPTYVIHSRDDQVVPIGPAEENAKQLAALGRTVKFEALSGPGHYSMGGYVESRHRAGRWIVERWSK